jgi:hypothetical protein
MKAQNTKVLISMSANRCKIASRARTRLCWADEAGKATPCLEDEATWQIK